MPDLSRFRPSRRIAMRVAAGLTCIALAAAILMWVRDGAIVVASIATAAATIVLAYVTRNLVIVTRDMAPRPVLVPSVWINADSVFFELHNAGDGAAIEVDIQVNWELGNHISANVSHRTNQWRASILPAGRRVRFIPPDINGNHMQAESLHLFDQVSVLGTMRNSRGEVVRVDESIKDPGELWDFEVESTRQPPGIYEPDEILAQQITKIATILYKRTPSPPESQP